MNLTQSHRWNPSLPLPKTAAFTMIEIAICLAIIGIALVGIIAVLPYGLNTQRDTREETIINQDVATLLPLITQGARGADDLTNYVYAITNYWTLYKPDGTLAGSAGTNGYRGYVGDGNPPVTSISSALYPNSPYSSVLITNGANIISVLSIPEFISTANNYPAVPGILNNDYNVYSNHIVAYVRSISGLATEKPPQNNDLMLNDAFSYRLLVVNAPVAIGTNSFETSFNRQFWQNQRELRMRFDWPILPNGKVGGNSQNFRATVAGQLALTYLPGQTYPSYFYQPQSFGVNTN